MSTIAESIRRFTCRIARRGKGAKGSVVVSLFGKPIAPKDKEKDDGITRKWDYSHHKDANTSDLIDSVKKLAHINLILMLGADAYLKSNGIQSQSELSIISMMIFNAGLALDADDAVATAKQFREFRSLAEKLRQPVPTIEALMENRKKDVDALKAKGLWRKEKATDSKAPRLVKKEKPVEEESDEEIDEEDIVDEESEEEISE